MYGRDDVELALYALEEGMGAREAAELVGCGVTAVREWSRGRLPHSVTGCASLRGGRARTGAGRTEEAAMARSDEAEDRCAGLYDAPATGPLSGLSPDQVENRLLRAVLDDLKAGGSLPGLTSNRSKAELGERLRRETGLPLRPIARFLGISKSSYEYWRRYSSYAGEIDAAPANLPLRADGTHDFSPASPNALWASDITEFRLPDAGKVYPSPVVDLFDSRPVAWAIGAHPTAALADESLARACAALGPGEAPVVHTDRGCHYRWPGWKSICREHGLTRSMSRKGRCADNAAMEGFFGRLKNEFFRGRDWSGVSAAEFARRLDRWMGWYRSGRLREFREGGEVVWDTIDGRRARLGLAV